MVQTYILLIHVMEMPCLFTVGRPQRVPLQDLQLCRDSQARQYRQPPEAEAQYFAHGLRSEVRVRQVTQQIKLPFQYSQ